MQSFLALASIVGLALGAAIPSFNNNNNALLARQDTDPVDCTDLHMIVARGSYESQNPGTGVTGLVTAAVCNEVCLCPGMDSRHTITDMSMSTD